MVRFFTRREKRRLAGGAVGQVWGAPSKAPCVGLGHREEQWREGPERSGAKGHGGEATERRGEAGGEAEEGEGGGSWQCNRTAKVGDQQSGEGVGKEEPRQKEIQECEIRGLTGSDTQECFLCCGPGSAELSTTRGLMSSQ